MRNFLISLLSGDEKGVNSIITCGMGAFLLHCGLTAYTAIAHGVYDATSFVGGMVGLGVFISGGKTVHDRWSSGAQSATVATPDATAVVETKP